MSKGAFVICFVLVFRSNAFCDEIPLEPEVTVEETEPSPNSKVSRFYNCKEFENDSNYTGHVCTFENYERRYDILPIGTSQIKEVDFIVSELFDVPQTMFKIFPKLTFVNMTNTLVKRLSNTSFMYAGELERLVLDENEVKEIPANAFQGAKKLEFLSMRDNLVEVIDRDAFKDAVCLKELDLSENFIESLEPETLHGLEKLTSLSLARNKLKELDIRVFYKTPTISIISLRDNDLKQLTLQFRDNSLTKMNIDNNAITQLKFYADDASFTNSTLSLSVHNNQISTFNDISARFNLITLRSSNNSIEDFTSILSRPTITILDMSYNNFGPILSNTLQNLTHLRELLLNGANVTDISPDAFLTNQNLQRLEVANNKLKINGASMFESAKALKALDISGNVIETGLNVNEFKAVLPNLERLDLEVEHL